MTVQLDMFQARQLRDDGIKQAVSHADAVHDDWSEKAFAFLQWFIKARHTPFMGEDVRLAAKDTLPEPPSNRAWGGIISRAAKSGLIKNIGYAKVKNKNAHCANASVWIKVS